MRKCIYLIAVVLFVACNNQNLNEEKPLETNIDVSLIKQVSAPGLQADAPFFTMNQDGAPVLSWTEGSNDSILLNYGSFVDSSFQVNSIDKSIGLSSHHESMPKLAFKSDGTIMAMFQKKRPTEENRFAGYIQYTMSEDSGGTWSTPRYLHQDTSAGIGRSFFDVEQLSNGEIGAVWLDGRKGGRSGSTLFFSKTEKYGGFESELEIAQKTCQCCRTELFVDDKESINVVFRDIIQDSIRDFAIVRSTDLGRTFTEPKVISEDNWVISGCPHTGASMSSINYGDISSLCATWYTMGGEPGVYFASSKDYGNSFEDRILLDKGAKHPQALGLSDDRLCFVWDEVVEKEGSYFARVVLEIHYGSERNRIYLSEDGVEANYPVLARTDESALVVAWTQGKSDSTSIQYVQVKLN